MPLGGPNEVSGAAAHVSPLLWSQLRDAGLSLSIAIPASNVRRAKWGVGSCTERPVLFGMIVGGARSS